MAVQAAKGKTTQHNVRINHTMSTENGPKSYIEHPPFLDHLQGAAQMLGSTQTEYLLVQFSVIALKSNMT